MVYLPGLDIAQHALLGRRPGGRSPPSALAARLEAASRLLCAFSIGCSRPFLTPAADELVVVVTEPGRVARSARARLIGSRTNAVRPHDVSASAATAVAPTVLYALGIPISRDLPGAPSGALRPAVHGPISACARLRPTAGRQLRPASRAGQPLDQEMIDRLRSLGYVR